MTVTPDADGVIRSARRPTPVRGVHGPAWEYRAAEPNGAPPIARLNASMLEAWEQNRPPEPSAEEQAEAVSRQFRAGMGRRNPVTARLDEIAELLRAGATPKPTRAARPAPTRAAATEAPSLTAAEQAQADDVSRSLRAEFGVADDRTPAPRRTTAAAAQITADTPGAVKDAALSAVVGHAVYVVHGGQSKGRQPARKADGKGPGRNPQLSGARLDRILSKAMGQHYFFDPANPSRRLDAAGRSVSFSAARPRTRSVRMVARP